MVQVLPALLASLTALAWLGEGPYRELLVSPDAQIFRVFVDERESPPQYNVLSDRRVLGSFELSNGHLVARPSRAGLPTVELTENQGWVLSPGGTALGLSEVTVEGRGARTEFFTYPRPTDGPAISVPGEHQVAISDDGAMLLFVRTGHTPRFPVRIQVVGPDGLPRREPVERDSLGRIRFSSASGRALAVQTGGHIDVFDDEGRQRIEGDGELVLGDAGRWLLVELPGQVVAHDLEDPAHSTVLPTRGPVLFMVAAGNYALVGAADQATLHDLSGAGRPVSFWPERGSRFSSGALLVRPDSGPLLALGQLDVRVQDVHLPEASEPGPDQPEKPEPLALASVTIHDDRGKPLESWGPFELGDWRAGSPELHWTSDGHLLATLPELAAISERTFP